MPQFLRIWKAYIAPRAMDSNLKYLWHKSLEAARQGQLHGSQFSTFEDII